MVAQPSIASEESFDEEDEPVSDDVLSGKNAWFPEPEVAVDWYTLEEQRKRLKLNPQILPSQFTEFAFRMPTDAGDGYEPFRFRGRRHMYRPYDTPAKRMLLVAARQVEKSTLLGNRAITYSCLLTGFRTLYVSPSATQTKTFSTDRIKDPMEVSPVLRAFTTNALQQNVFEKQFVNRSKITLRYAFLNADRCRGIPATSLLLDEIQDILGDNIPIIEQCTSHAPEQLKRFIYAGTPKSLDNIIEYYRSSLSTQGEWVVPCDNCGSKAGAGRYWNVLGEKNIGKKSLICEKCGKPINAQHVDAQWAFMVEPNAKTAPFESYRIPQLMVPWKNWDEILLDYARYPRDKFYNEVLGISFDSGLRPLSSRQIMDCCVDSIRMHPQDLEKYRNWAYQHPVFAGIDWGCHDDQTRILTESGFKYFKDLKDTDRVAQWDPGSRQMSFVLPTAKTDKEWSGELLHFQAKGSLDLLVTPDHRMRVAGNQGKSAWVTEKAEDTAARGGNTALVGYVDWVGVEQPSFTLPGVPVSPGYPGSHDRTFRMDDWVELVGYLVSEGGLCFQEGRPSCVKMSQRVSANPETYAKMQALLDRMELPYKAFPNPKTTDVNWTIYGKQYWKWFLENIGERGYLKRLPRELLSLSQRQLQILFTAMVDGDGHRDPRPGCTGGTYTSTSRGLCEDFLEVCIRLGLRGQVKYAKAANGNKREQWVVQWSQGRDHVFNTPSSKVTKVPYNGRVYCVTVPSGYIVTERNGCISYQGNSGEHAYTVLTLGMYPPDSHKFRVFYIHRFVGEDVDPEAQLVKIIQMLRYFNVRITGADYGGGYYPNDRLTRTFGAERVLRYQYMARTKKKVLWNPPHRRYMVHRTDVMTDIFNAIKRKQFEFPRWEEFGDPYAQDCLNIYSEYNESLRMLQYTHRPDKPDDSFHSLLYCLLASMVIRPRPDIIAPTREDPTRGPIHSSYSGPTNQG